ncbi:MAG: AAA family ATPase [Polyangiaceae bacterium]|nr:AAA family ATPase [Polyangiaceae bacterium]
MYLSSDAVVSAINVLRSTVHPFIGITFLACKRFALAVGSTAKVSLDSLTREHMDAHHRIDRRSAHYFQPFRSSGWWVVDKYPSSGLQTINTQTFITAFLHPRKSQNWGFARNYLSRIQRILSGQNLQSTVPADALAVWLFKDRNVGAISTYEELVDLFFAEFNINEEERTQLFADRSEALLTEERAFSPEPLEMTSVIREFPEPPDAQAEGGRTIKSLRLANAGPAQELSIEFGPRLSIITGDNGLGKSFLLDFTWWAATGSWAERQALPRQDVTSPVPVVEYSLAAASGRVLNFHANFNHREFRWVRPRDAMTVEALAVFSRADGSFAIADPARNTLNQSGIPVGSLTAFEVWNGRAGLIEGLVRDWIRWQTAADQKTFDLLVSVLKRLSPEDLGTLTPGKPVRLPNEPRDIPTIQHRYATIPVTHASSGVQRALLLAYLMIWSWREHELASQYLGREPLHRMMVLVDELEAHLHPKWQRIVLPALIGVGNLLSSDLAMQMIAATHSPMILASMEAEFDPSTDVLYHLFGDGPVVRLEEMPFIKYGDVSGWLTSPVFGLRHARSRGAEQAIEAAKSLQLVENPTAQQICDVSNQLKQHLAGDDKFWPRWLFFAEQHGVEL